MPLEPRHTSPVAPLEILECSIMLKGASVVGTALNPI